MTNVTQLPARTPLDRYKAGAASLDEDEGTDAILLLNRVRTSMILSPDEERLLLKMMGRPMLRQTEGDDG